MTASRASTTSRAYTSGTHARPAPAASTPAAVARAADARAAAAAIDRLPGARFRWPAWLHGHRALREVGTFAAIGVASTLAYVVLYAALRTWTPATTANALSLILTAVGNTAANRRLTFGVHGREGLARDHAAGMLAFGIALAITSGALLALDRAAPGESRAAELAVLVTANALATLVRFLLLRLAISPTARRGVVGHPPAHAPVPERISR